METSFEVSILMIQLIFNINILTSQELFYFWLKKLLEFHEKKEGLLLIMETKLGLMQYVYIISTLFFIISEKAFVLWLKFDFFHFLVLNIIIILINNNAEVLQENEIW